MYGLTVEDGEILRNIDLRSLRVLPEPQPDYTPPTGRFVITGLSEEEARALLKLLARVQKVGM